MVKSRIAGSAVALFVFITAFVPFDRSRAAFTIGVIQEPEWGTGYLAQASVWNWSGSGYQNGWTMARYYRHGVSISNWLHMQSNLGLILDDPNYIGDYALAENYWSGYYSSAHSCVLGNDNEGEAVAEID